jgi:hypothetical protein
VKTIRTWLAPRREGRLLILDAVAQGWSKAKIVPHSSPPEMTETGRFCR